MVLIVFTADPFRLLVAYIKVKGLRLWDLFSQFDKDGSMSVSRAEFREGIKVTCTKSLKLSTQFYKNKRISNLKDLVSSTKYKTFII